MGVEMMRQGMVVVRRFRMVRLMVVMGVIRMLDWRFMCLVVLMIGMGMWNELI